MMNCVTKRSVLMLTVTAYATFQVTPTTDVVLSPGHLTKPRVRHSACQVLVTRTPF